MAGGFDIEKLLAEAEAGGPGAALAARRAAALAEAAHPEQAKRALTLAARLDPYDAAPRLALARVHAENGDIDAARAEASALLSEAVDEAARARAAFMLGEIARALGERENARTYFAQTATIEEGLLKADRSSPHAARWFARARGRLAEIDAAEGALARAQAGAEGALAMLKATAAQISETPLLAADIADAEMRLGAIELDRSAPESARRRFGEAIARYEALTLIEPDETHWRAMLADCWALAAEADFARGAGDAARSGIDKAMAVRAKLARGDDHERWGLAGLMRTRGALLAALGDAKGAALSLEQARLIAEQIAADGAALAQRFLVQTLRDQTDHALRTGDLETARAAADAARRIAEPRARDKDAEWLSELAACWDRLGEYALAARGAAQDPFARAAEFRRMAHDAARDDPSHRRALTTALIKAGDAAARAGERNGAHAYFSEAVSHRLALSQAAPDDPGAAHALAIALERLGLAAAARGDAEEARAAWESELDLAGRIFTDPHAPETLRFCAIVESHLAGLGGVDSGALREAALSRLDALASAGALTERDIALRKKLWSA
ncbi:MAG: hypothetical protein AB7G05_04275 [Hyphomonadaceae bacterium]